MKINIIKCDICYKEIENSISSTFPTYITIKMSGEGTRKSLNREYDICEECLWKGIVLDQVDKHLRIYSRKEIPRNAER